MINRLSLKPIKPQKGNYGIIAIHGTAEKWTQYFNFLLALMQIMAEIKIRTEEILLQCRYAGVISLSGPRPSSEDRGGGQGGCRVPQKLPVWVEWVVLLNASS